jgi:hypothetical protein
MKSWAEKTDLAGPFAGLSEEQAALKSVEMVKGGKVFAGGAAAKPAIQLGYVSCTMYLAKKAEAIHAK